jgi:hypothetical protein
MVITITAIIKLMGTGFGISEFYSKLMQIISQDFYVFSPENLRFYMEVQFISLILTQSS